MRSANPTYNSTKMYRLLQPFSVAKPSQPAPITKLDQKQSIELKLPTAPLVELGPAPFIKVTAISDSLFSGFKCADEENLTRANRYISDYSELLGLSLEKEISLQATRTGRKLKIGDIGCGEGRVIQELLGKLADRIESATGISLHYFRNIEQVMKLHKGKFQFYFGGAQLVLPKLPNEFDIITDVFSAIYYSPDKIDLLKNYFLSLKPGGKAFIALGSNEFDRSTVLIRGKEIELTEMLAGSYPKLFSRKIIKNGSSKKQNYASLTMTKTMPQWPLPSFKFHLKREDQTIGDPDLTLAQLRTGNAVCQVGTFVPEEDPIPHVQLPCITKKR